jgi:hypothetical protein
LGLSFFDEQALDEEHRGLFSAQLGALIRVRDVSRGADSAALAVAATLLWKRPFSLTIFIPLRRHMPGEEGYSMGRRRERCCMFGDSKPQREQAYPCPLDVLQVRWAHR